MDTSSVSPGAPEEPLYYSCRVVFNAPFLSSSSFMLTISCSPFLLRTCFDLIYAFLATRQTLPISQSRTKLGTCTLPLHKTSV